MSDTCKWYPEDSYDNEHFSTSCEEIQHFSDGDIQSNGYKFCPYCGKEIEEVKP
jgi:hypothetical protein